MTKNFDKEQQHQLKKTGKTKVTGKTTQVVGVQEEHKESFNLLQKQAKQKEDIFFYNWIQGMRNFFMQRQSGVSWEVFDSAVDATFDHYRKITQNGTHPPLSKGKPINNLVAYAYKVSQNNLHDARTAKQRQEQKDGYKQVTSITMLDKDGNQEALNFDELLERYKQEKTMERQADRFSWFEEVYRKEFTSEHEAELEQSANEQVKSERERIAQRFYPSARLNDSREEAWSGVRSIRGELYGGYTFGREIMPEFEFVRRLELVKNGKVNRRDLIVMFMFKVFQMLQGRHGEEQYYLFMKIMSGIDFKFPDHTEIEEASDRALIKIRKETQYRDYVRLAYNEAGDYVQYDPKTDTMDHGKSLCSHCEHFSKISFNKCKAFPEGIPEEIKNGEVIHQEIRPDQKGFITWKPRKDIQELMDRLHDKKWKEETPSNIDIAEELGIDSKKVSGLWKKEKDWNAKREKLEAQEPTVDKYRKQGLTILGFQLVRALEIIKDYDAKNADRIQKRLEEYRQKMQEMTEAELEYIDKMRLKQWGTKKFQEYKAQEEALKQAVKQYIPEILEGKKQN